MSTNNCGWNEAIGKVKDDLPRFNDYILRGFRQDQVNRFPDFMNVVFTEATKLFGNDLKYQGYRVLCPERRIAYNVENALTKGRVNVQQSELELVEFNFQYDGHTIGLYLYLPYLYNGALVINDTKFYIQHAIIERMIYRVTDGVIIKVMRSPIQFWRTEQFKYTSTEGKTYYDAIITVKAHYKKQTSAKAQKTPLILYLLTTYDFDYVVQQTLGLPAGSISFVSEPKEHDKKFTYFKCKENIYLKVETTTVLEDTSFRRFVASVLHILSMSRRFNIADVYDKTFYKMILGKNIYGSGIKEALAAGHAESHLDSLSTYLDQYTKGELARMQIYCNDIFDLFAAVFFNIDTWLIRYSPNDLFDKRLGGADLILMDMVKTVFTKFYDTLKKNKVITLKQIISMLRMDPMRVAAIRKQSLQPSASLYNDNMLLSVFIKKVRQSSSQESASNRNVNVITAKEHQMHPSFLAIESVLSVSSSSPGITGDINPYAEVDRMGYFQKDKMPWYEDIEPLSKYLIQV